MPYVSLSCASRPRPIPARALLAVAVLAAVVLAAACGGADIAPADDLAGLVESLQQAGFDTPEQEETNMLESRFFDVPGVALVVPGRRILAFEFADESQAGAQAALVSADGSGIGNKFVGWRDTPHFFSRGRLIVIYQGDDQKTLDALEETLGPQFAGE